MQRLLDQERKNPSNGYPKMKKNLSVIVEDQDLIELLRILMDDDAEAALAFLRKHFKGKVRNLLEGG